jgi:hypothetical protein
MRGRKNLFKPHSREDGMTVKKTVINLSLKYYLADSNGIISAFVGHPRRIFYFVDLIIISKPSFVNTFFEKRRKNYALRFLRVYG